MRFEWTDLRIFLHVCEAGSMTAAATRAHLTLAAVSARMRSLEASCGIVLLERRARGVVPTAAGEVLAAHARLVFDQVQRLQRDLLQAHGDAPRRTVLLANSSALARPLADAFLEGEPAPEVRPLLVRESASEATVQALRSGAADVGIVSDAVETRGLVAKDLGPDPLVLVVARTHALAARPVAAFRDALAQPWVAWGEQGALSAHLQMRAIALGTPIAPRVSYPALAGVLRLVAGGIGVTVLPRAVLPGDADAAGVACIAMEDPWAGRRLLVCRPEGGDALRAELVERICRAWRA